MITFTHTPSPSSPPEVNLAPLIDIIFNLMIFLLITAVFTARGILFNLPQATATRPAPSHRIEITLTETDTLMVEQQACTLSELESILKAKLDDAHWNGSEKIFITACRRASVGQLVRVMDTARAAGFDNVILAAGKKTP